MKKSSNLLILAAIFAVLLAMVLIISNQQKTGDRTARLDETRPLFPELEVDSVYRIELKTLHQQSGDYVSKESLIFRLRSGDWEVASGSFGPDSDPNMTDDQRTFYRADTDKVDAILEMVDGLMTGDVVTSDAAKQTEMGVLDGTVGVEVILSDNNQTELASVILGNYMNSKTFLRLPDSDEIRSVAGNHSQLVQLNLGDSRSRQIYSARPDQVSEVSVTDYDNGWDFDLLKSAGEWFATDAEGVELTIDPARVDSLVETLGNLSVNTFVDPMRVPVPSTTDLDYDITSYWPSDIPIYDGLTEVHRGGYYPEPNSTGDVDSVKDEGCLSISGGMSSGGSSLFGFYNALEGWTAGEMTTNTITTPVPPADENSDPGEITVTVNTVAYTAEGVTLKVRYIEQSDGVRYGMLTLCRDSGDYTDLDLWGFANPRGIVEFTTTTGETHNLIVGIQEGTTVYAYADDNLSDIYKVSINSINSILKDPALLDPANEEEAPVDAMDPELQAGDEIDIESILADPNLDPEIRAMLEGAR